VTLDVEKTTDHRSAGAGGEDWELAKLEGPEQKSGAAHSVRTEALLDMILLQLKGPTLP
jgi:hypothetical protein